MRTLRQILEDVKRRNASDKADLEHEREWPAPEVWARPAVRDEIPRGAMTFARIPGVHGYATYARGPVGQQAHPGWRMADSVVLRMTSGERRATAAWVDGKFAVAFAHGIGQVNATQLKAYFTQDILELPWLVDRPLKLGPH